MRCPQCGGADTRVIETRTADEGQTVRRRRECSMCGFRFTTYERIEVQKVLWISKKDGRREAFDRAKLIRGISRACERLPVPLSVIEDIANRVEMRLRETVERKAATSAGAIGSRRHEGAAGELSSMTIGEQVMKELAEINKVAYVRFASVYREFTDISSFQQEISKLISRADQSSVPSRNLLPASSAPHTRGGTYVPATPDGSGSETETADCVPFGQKRES